MARVCWWAPDFLEERTAGTGVLLAGANLHGRGKETGSEDGILTALEVSL
jgi:hypothetical protein